MIQFNGLCKSDIALPPSIASVVYVNTESEAYVYRLQVSDEGLNHIVLCMSRIFAILIQLSDRTRVYSATGTPSATIFLVVSLFS